MKNISKFELTEKILSELKEIVGVCRLCPRECGVDRLKGQKGTCGLGPEPIVYTSFSHHGEEPPISSVRGSGTIFFSGCGMQCVYCQNHIFSQNSSGKGTAPESLAEMMLKLQDMGCHNINLVNPAFFLPSIVEALKRAFSRGLDLPIVYNTGGYDSVDIIRRLDGLIDIYLPDMRYSQDEMAEKFSGVSGYVQVNRETVKEMYRQVGELKIKDGVAVKGLIIRLLVLPEEVSGTEDTLEFIAKNLGKNVSISLMSQYYPAYKASSFASINRKISRDEYDRAVKKAEDLGFEAGWIQPFGENFDRDLFGENFDQMDSQ